jgi:hypothetical protein
VTSFNDVLDAVCDVVTSTTGVRATQYIDKPVLPCVLVYLDDSIGDPLFRSMKAGVVDVPVVVHVMASSTDLEGQMRWVHDLVSPWNPAGVPQAIFVNRTLGTAADENTGNAAASMSAHVDSIDDTGTASLLDGTRVCQARVRVTVKLTRGAN